MTRCPECGAENPEDAEVCQVCGESLILASPPPRLLSQIQGLIPAEPVITTGRLADARHIIPLDQLPTYSELLGLPSDSEGPPPPEPSAPPSPPSSFPSGLAKKARVHSLWVLAGLFLLAAWVGAGWKGGVPAVSLPSDSVKNAYTFIEILRTDARVLVAWDYDPATQGELDLLARPLLYHLQRQQAQLTFVSLRPFGPDVAADAYVSTAARHPATAQAAPVPVMLGFLPGEDAALRALSLSPIAASSAPRLGALATGLSPDQDLESFDLIILLTADFRSASTWVEQVAGRSPVPLVMASSAAIAPLLRPFEQTRQVRALLAGYPDALAYEQLLKEPGIATDLAASQTWVSILFLGVVLGAALRSVIRIGRR